MNMGEIGSSDEGPSRPEEPSEIDSSLTAHAMETHTEEHDASTAHKRNSNAPSVQVLSLIAMGRARRAADQAEQQQ